MGNKLRKVFLGKYGSLRPIWYVVIFIIFIFLIMILCINLIRIDCERSAEIVADGYHYGWIEGCFYEIDGVMIADGNYGELYKNQELTIKGELKLDGR